MTFEQARAQAYRLLGDAADWMRGLAHTDSTQARAVTRFFRAIDAAKTALNDAHRAHQARETLR